MTPALINDAGLVLDIVGAVLLFMFGLPASIDRQGNVHLITGQKDQAEIAKGRLYDRWGKIGLVLLVVGFALQLASNHVSIDPRSSCGLSEPQRDVVLRKVAAKIAELEDDSTSYDIGKALDSSGLFQLDDGQCYAYLYSISRKEGYSILDGDGGVYIDPKTLEVGDVFWFRY